MEAKSDNWQSWKECALLEMAFYPSAWPILTSQEKFSHIHKDIPHYHESYALKSSQETKDFDRKICIRFAAGAADTAAQKRRLTTSSKGLSGKHDNAI